MNSTGTPPYANTMSTLSRFRLDGARALVTGASRGIGRAVAEALAEAGADLAVAARTVAALKETVHAVEEHGHTAAPLGADLAEPESATHLIDHAAAALGGLDIVVHCAGILPQNDDGTPALGPFHSSRQHDWDAVIAVNLGATAQLCRAAHPHLSASRQASVVLLSSAAGLIGAPMMESYAASKAGQISLARSLAVGWARQGIRVNALCPGWTRTDMTAFATRDPALSDWLTSHVPLGRWADPQEVACAALFLAAPASSYLTGHTLIVDGGSSIPDAGLAGYPKPASPFAAA